MAAPPERPVTIRPKLAWRVGPVVVVVALVGFGDALAAYVIAAMFAVFAVYAWTTRVDVSTVAIEKRPWGVRRERVARPVRELEYIHATFVHRAIEVGPMGASIVLEVGF